MPKPQTTMTVIEAARLTGVPAHVVRYYTRIGLLHPRRARGNGYRLYCDQDLRRLRFIRHAQALGCTLAEICDLLQVARGRRQLPEEAVDMLAERLKENRKSLELALEAQATLEGRFRRWRRELPSEASGKDIARLVELTGDPECPSPWIPTGS